MTKEMTRKEKDALRRKRIYEDGNIGTMHAHPNIVCKDCVWRETREHGAYWQICEMYEGCKPDEVFYEGKECPEYRSEEYVKKIYERDKEKLDRELAEMMKGGK